MATSTPIPTATGLEDRRQQHLEQQRRHLQQQHNRAMMVPGPDNYAAHTQPHTMTMSSRSYNNGGMAKPLIWDSPLQRLTRDIFDRVVDHDQLRQTHMHSLQGVIRVSRAFRETAMPAFYRALEPNRQLLEDLLHGDQERVLQHVGRFTRGVIARSNLNLDGVRRILQRANQWIAVVYRNVQDASSVTPTATTVNIYLPALLDDPEDDIQPEDQEQPHPPFAHIEHIRHRGPHLLALPESDHRPAPRRLSLESYDWQHTPAEARRHFDLSRLQDLRLRRVPVARFLQSVDMADLAGVTRLQLGDVVHDDEEQAGELIGELLQEHIAALHTLELTGNLSSFDVVSLTRHANDLTTLRLRGGTLALKQMDVLADTLHDVTELELDLDAAGPAQGHLLAAMMRFQSLQRLTLHVPALDTAQMHDGTTSQQQQAQGILSSLLWSLFSAGQDAPPLQHLTVRVGSEVFNFERHGSTFRLVGQEDDEQVLEDVQAFFEDSSDWDIASMSLQHYLEDVQKLLDQHHLDWVQMADDAVDADEMSS